MPKERIGTVSTDDLKGEIQRIAAGLLKRPLGGKQEAACGLKLDQRHDPKHGLPRRWDGGPIAPAGIERPACSSSHPVASFYCIVCLVRSARRDGTGCDRRNLSSPRRRQSQSGVAQNDEEAA